MAGMSCLSQTGFKASRLGDREDGHGWLGTGERRASSAFNPATDSLISTEFHGLDSKGNTGLVARFLYGSSSRF